MKDRTDFVEIGNVFERFKNLVALAASRNAVVDDLGRGVGGIVGEKVGCGECCVFERLALTRGHVFFDRVVNGIVFFYIRN